MLLILKFYKHNRPSHHLESSLIIFSQRLKKKIFICVTKLRITAVWWNHPYYYQSIYPAFVPRDMDFVELGS